MRLFIAALSGAPPHFSSPQLLLVHPAAAFAFPGLLDCWKGPKELCPYPAGSSFRSSMPPFHSNLLSLLPSAEGLEGIRVDKGQKGARGVRA